MTRFGHKLNYVINTFVKHTPDQGCVHVNSFKHLSKQSIRINTFNIFSKVMFYKGWLGINVMLRMFYYIQLGNG